MAHAVVDGYQWIDAILRADTQLQGYAPGGLFTDVAKTTTSTPYLIIALQGATDLNTANAHRIWTEGIYQVKAVGPATAATKLGQAANRIDALLTQGTVVDGFKVYCWRDSPLYYPETVSGEPWRHLGGLYRLIIEPSA
jgi:hypothetical protein